MITRGIARDRNAAVDCWRRIFAWTLTTSRFGKQSTKICDNPLQNILIHNNFIHLILKQFYRLILHTLPGNGSMIPIGMNTAAVAATRFFEMHPSDLLLFFSKVVCVNCTLHIFSINETIIGKNAQTLRYVSNNINVVIRNTADTMYNGRKHITRNIFSLLSTLISLFSLMWLIVDTR